MNYLSRIVDAELDLRLRSVGATLIVGPKWCGKTTTAKQHAKSVLEMQNPDLQAGFLQLAETKPSLLLQGEKPRLIDEWQLAPVLWDAVRVAVDKSSEKGQYILTGSVVKDDSQTKHTGTGRISRLEMCPMTLWESAESSGTISLSEMFKNPDNAIDGATSKLSIEELLFAACRGGWPSALNAKGDDAKLFIAADYVNNVAEVDISKVDNVDRDPLLASLLLKSYARNISTLASKANIRRDLLAVQDISMPTVDSYLAALRKLFVICDIPAWCPAIRSSASMRSTPKRGMCDPSVAVAALGATPEYFLKDFKTFGFIFESLVMRDLKVYSMALGGKLSYYHDRYGLEADAVLHLKDGRYALIEIKLGSSEIEEGAKHLLEIRQLIREYNKTEKQCPLAEPDLLMVVTGGAMGYTRNDGVHIVPISAMKP
jgi:predicted AAA+ superfamily ATPase